MHNEAHGQDLGAHLHRVDAREHRLQFLLIIRIDNGYLGLDDDGNCEDFEMFWGFRDFWGFRGFWDFQDFWDFRDFCGIKVFWDF